MRENKRYLFVKGDVGCVEQAILDFVGVLGMSKAGLNWIRKSGDSAVISVNREAVDFVRAGFCVWSKEIRVEKVSGTLKGLGKK